MKSALLNADLEIENLKVFDFIRVGLLLINKNKEIVRINATAMEMLGSSLNIPVTNETCHHLIFKSPSTCPDCPLLNNGSSIPQDRSIKKKTDNNDVFLKEQFSFFGENILITLHDLTREISLLRNLDLSRKELNAKNIILKQKHRETEKQLGNLKNIFDHLPDLLVNIDSSCRITYCNSAVREIYGDENPQMCFEIMGQVDKCEQCPLDTKGFKQTPIVKKSHKINDKFYTEEFNLFSPEKGGTLVFRDTTRQIQLIEQIREQSEVVNTKNKLLSGLTDLEIKMHREVDPRAVLEYFLDIFLPLYRSDACAIIISDIRFASIWFTIQKGLNEDNITVLSKSFISREVQTSRLAEIPKELLPWEETSQFCLFGSYDRLIGIVLIKGFGSKDSKELTNVFKEPLSAFIQNRLLMRQLEEKANTDPLTGLFNRGYIDKAIAEEELKLEKFNIPFSVVMVDVNGLKKANDLYGHAIGDQLILAVSKKLKSSIRVADVVARTGGDEFIILLTGTNDEGAQKFIARVKNIDFQNFCLEIGNQEKLQVSASFGGAGTDKYSPENLIKESDRLMYEAKNSYYLEHTRYR